VKQRNALTKISKRNLKTARAYRYKLALQEVFKTIKSEDAEIELKKIISWGLKSRIIPNINFAKMLKNHFDGIKRYFISRLTSGAVEGINSRIQELKSRARGYTNVEHLKKYDLPYYEQFNDLYAFWTWRTNYR
jgi:transposase